MKKSNLTVAALGVVAFAATLVIGTTLAQDYKAGSLSIDDPWARVPIGSVPNTAAYMKLSNAGDAPDRLIAVKSNIAKHVMLHESRMEGDVMKMVHMDGGVAIPAQGSVELKPLGLHVMLMGLSRPLKKGETFPMTLVFEKQGDVPIEVEVGQPR